MKAVLPTTDRERARPVLGELPEPEPGPGELLLEVRAAGLNRADALQLRGLYPPPPGEPLPPGLECSGVVARVGEGVVGWREGDRAMALLGGGGQAERVAVPAGQAMPLPESLSFVAGAALPEAALTSWTNLVVEGSLAAGETVVITGATGGVGTFAVQLARELGGIVVGAGRDPERLARLAALGAHLVLADDDTLPAAVHHHTGGRGADLVLDLVGGPLLPAHLGALREQGRLVLVGLMAGAQAQLDLAPVMRRRLTFRGSVLRSRRREEKAALVAGFWEFAGSRLAAGRLLPVVERVYPFSEIADAYQALERGGNFGKLVVER